MPPTSMLEADSTVRWTFNSDNAPTEKIVRIAT